MARAEVLDPDLRKFLESLNSAGVTYLLVGGYAVNYHGYHRATDDLDVWIAIDPANAKRVSRVLQEFAGFPAGQVPPRLFLQPDRNLMLGREPLRIDILTGISGVDFAACYERRVKGVIDGLPVPVISLADLKANETASGRLKDAADLENLPATAPREKKKAKRRRDSGS
jgi:hypothetical protein